MPRNTRNGILSNEPISMQGMVKRAKSGKQKPKPETLISQRKLRLNVPDVMRSWSFIPILIAYIIIARIVVYNCALDNGSTTSKLAVVNIVNIHIHLYRIFNMVLGINQISTLHRNLNIG